MDVKTMRSGSSGHPLTIRVDQLLFPKPGTNFRFVVLGDGSRTRGEALAQLQLAAKPVAGRDV
jgi:hypothetical protein